MPAIAGLRGTGQFTVDFRPTNYRELFTLLEPNGSAPLNALLAMTASEETDDPKYNHFRDELPGRVVQIRNAGGYNASATSIAVDATDDVNFVIPNALLANVRTGEVMRVTALPGAAGGSPSVQSLTVSRNVSGTSLAINDRDFLVLMGYADQEGGSKPTAVTWDPSTDFNYTQIFKTGVNITGTMRETYLRTGSKEQEMVTKSLKLHMADIERTFFWGRRHIENPSTATPRRYTGGLISMIPNVIDAASGFATANTITEREFDRLLIENIFAWGGKQKIAFMGARCVSNLMRIAKEKWRPTNIGGAYGVTFTQYNTFAGDLLVYLHPMFRQVPGMESTAVILDLPYVKYRYMKNRDTKLMRDVQAPDTDGKEHFYQTECGLDLRQGKPHSIIRNWLEV